MIRNTMRNIDRQFARLDRWIIETFVTTVRPSERCRQVAGKLDRLDRAVIAVIRDAASTERRQQVRSLIASGWAQTRATGGRVRAVLRRPETEEMAEIRHGAGVVSDRITRLIRESGNSLPAGCVVELARWSSIMAMEAEGESADRVAPLLVNPDAMRAGNRAMSDEMGNIAVKRDLNADEQTSFFLATTSRIVFARARHQYGKISSDALAWEIVAAREDQNLYLTAERRETPERQPFSELRAITEAMPNRRDREVAA